MRTISGKLTTKTEKNVLGYVRKTKQIRWSADREAEIEEVTGVAYVSTLVANEVSIRENLAAWRKRADLEPGKVFW